MKTARSSDGADKVVMKGYREAGGKEKKKLGNANDAIGSWYTSIQRRMRVQVATCIGAREREKKTLN